MKIRPYRINIDMITNETDYIEEQGGADVMVEKAVEWLNNHGFECAGTDDIGEINHGLDEDNCPSDALWEQMLREVFP